MENASVINELLDAAKSKTGAASDYKLAQVLDLPTQRISDYRAGSRTPDAYGCARIAEALGLDPLEVIARVEAEAAKSERARSYWRSFTGGVRRTMIVGGALWLTASFSGGAPTIGAAQAAEAITHNGRFRQRTAKSKAPDRGLFFRARDIER